MGVFQGRAEPCTSSLERRGLDVRRYTRKEALHRVRNGVLDTSPQSTEWGRHGSTRRGREEGERCWGCFGCFGSGLHSESS